MPTAEQPAATGKDVTSTYVIRTHLISVGMDMTVTLPKTLYAIIRAIAGVIKIKMQIIPAMRHTRLSIQPSSPNWIVRL